MGAAGALRPRMEHRAAGSPHTGSGTADASLLTPSASASVRKARQRRLFTAVRRIPWAVSVKVLVATGHHVFNKCSPPQPLFSDFPSPKVGTPIGNSMA